MFRSIFSILILVISVGGIIIFAAPQYQQAQKVKAQVVQLEDAFARATQLRALRQSLEERFNSFSGDDLKKLDAMLPTYVDNVRIAVLDINTLATQYGLTLRDVTTADPTIIAPRPGEEANPIGAIQIDFSVSGPYDGFVALMEHLERSLRIIDIDSATFTALQKRDDRPLDWYDYQVSMSTYWLRPQ